MASLSSFRAVYKRIAEREIDVDIYLPQSNGCDGISCPILINIHGGAFMLGSSKMVNKDQIQDCLERGWIVVVPNHRLCPQVNLFEGPIQDCRDLLQWIHEGQLQESIRNEGESSYSVDLDHIFSFGTSSGGTLALCLGFGVPQPVAGIYDMYGPCHFDDEFWTTEIPDIAAKLPKNLSEEFLARVFDNPMVPITGGVSLEGQAVGPPDFSDPRQAYAFTQIARGNVMRAIFPSRNWDRVDPLRNISSSFPPTFIVHGAVDLMVPIRLSRELLKSLEEHKIPCGMQEIPAEGHTFAAKMQKGSLTWKLQRKGFDFLQTLL